MLEMLKELFKKFSQRRIGYTNLLFYKLGLLEEEVVISYNQKKKLCTKDCPLKSHLFGIEYCDWRKEYNGEFGCGCIIEAKLFSDSPCPLNKF